MKKINMNLGIEFNNVNREDLIKNIEQLISLLKKVSSPDFPGIDIKSYQYYQEVLLPILSNKKNYSIVLGDINKLSVINNIHGKDARR